MIGDGDLAIFSNGDFNVEAAFGSLKVNGWFTGATQQSSQFGNEIETTLPMFDCPTADIVSVVRGDTVVINGTTYAVERKHDLGIGVTTLSLKT